MEQITILVVDDEKEIADLVEILSCQRRIPGAKGRERPRKAWRS